MLVQSVAYRCFLCSKAIPHGDLQGGATGETGYQQQGVGSGSLARRPPQPPPSGLHRGELCIDEDRPVSRRLSVSLPTALSRTSVQMRQLCTVRALQRRNYGFGTGCCWVIFVPRSRGQNERVNRRKRATRGDAVSVDVGTIGESYAGLLTRPDIRHMKIGSSICCHRCFPIALELIGTKFAQR